MSTIPVAGGAWVTTIGGLAKELDKATAVKILLVRSD